MAFPFSKSSLPTQLFINNEYVESKHSEKLTVYNPKDGSLVCDSVPKSGEKDVDAAVSAAEKAFLEWRKSSNATRQKLMLKLADLIETNSEKLAELSRITMGAPYKTFGQRETTTAVEVC